MGYIPSFNASHWCQILFLMIWACFCHAMPFAESQLSGSMLLFLHEMCYWSQPGLTREMCALGRSHSRFPSPSHSLFPPPFFPEVLAKSPVEWMTVQSELSCGSWWCVLLGLLLTCSLMSGPVLLLPVLQSAPWCSRDTYILAYWSESPWHHYIKAKIYTYACAHSCPLI